MFLGAFQLSRECHRNWIVVGGRVKFVKFSFLMQLISQRMVRISKAVQTPETVPEQVLMLDQSDSQAKSRVTFCEVDDLEMDSLECDLNVTPVPIVITVPLFPYPITNLRLTIIGNHRVTQLPKNGYRKLGTVHHPGNRSSVHKYY